MRSKILPLLALCTLTAACGDPAEFPDDPADAPVDQQSQGLFWQQPGSPLHNGFDAAVRMHGWFCVGDEACDLGDFDGDGRADLVTFVPANGRVYVGQTAAGGDRVWRNTVWSQGLARAGSQYAIGDVDGDGDDDVVRVDPDTRRAYVALSDGAGAFAAPALWRWSVCQAGEVCRLGDVDGDGDADLVRFLKNSVEGPGAGDVWVHRSTGAGFEPGFVWHGWFCVGDETCDVADFNGDGRDDAVTFVNGAGIDNGPVWVARSNGAAFVDGRRSLEQFCAAGQVCTAGDVDGDGRADLVAFANGTGALGSYLAYTDDVYVALTHLVFGGPWTQVTDASIRHGSLCPADHVCRVGDTDGDGRDDLVAFARDALSGDGRGDVFVARSNFGDEKAWTFDMSSIRAHATEGDGDQPLILGLGFQATFGRAGSTVITRNAYDEEFARGIVADGPSIDIPAAVGELRFEPVHLRTPSEAYALQPIALMGAAVLVIEKDLSAAAAYGGLMDEAEAALRIVLEEAVEGTTPLDFLSPDLMETTLDAVQQRLEDTVMVSIVDDILHLYLSAPWDPDDIVDVHLYIFPAVDKSLRSVLPPSPDARLITVAVPGEGPVGFTPWQRTFANGTVDYRIVGALRPTF